MNRILLTLLALLTGLVAPVASANAVIRGKGEAQVSAVQVIRGTARLPARSAMQAASQIRTEHRLGAFDSAPLPGLGIRIQATLIGIDRARE
jgi:uncharacterized protein YcfJ